MGLFDSVLGAAQQALGAQQGASQGSPDLMQLAIGLLGNQGGQGGLASLVQAFEQGGLGSVVQSWIGTGANLPVSAEQLQAVLGSEKVSALAAQVGLNPADLSQQLSGILPGLVDQLTPHGTLPQDGGLGSLAQLATQFLGGMKG
ncbi:YidB family protein [Aquabacterium sp.]|jgi:uncharacterized protein YidB (DUF937 family)|uniref:YidB family protein n=1 Tax=Aquabacterium sp. TaxID=1872578 RepID=UPI0025BA8ED7|nr:YidB family protein [Aquabacterium sp.]